MQAHLAEFEARGVRLVAISNDPPDALRDLRTKAGYKFTFLSDPRAEVIRQYDLVDAGAGPDGSDIARPAEFLIDPSGTVRWRLLTPSYAQRARPEQILKAIEAS
jgi:peroxiredoxin